MECEFFKHPQKIHLKQLYKEQKIEWTHYNVHGDTMSEIETSEEYRSSVVTRTIPGDDSNSVLIIENALTASPLRVRSEVYCGLD